jgi:hypothetical protein
MPGEGQDMDHEPEQEAGRRNGVVDDVGRTLETFFDPFHPERQAPLLLLAGLVFAVGCGITLLWGAR